MNRILKPDTRPEDPRFSSGPCAKPPTWKLKKLSDAAVGRTDREKVGREKLKKAIEEGDVNGQADAQSILARASLDAERAKIQKEQLEAQAAKFKEQKEETAPPVVEQQAPPPPDPKAQQWAEKNEWFGQDEVMTYAAFGIHRKLVEEEGFDPQSDEYYNEVDSRIRTEFPHKFNSARKNGGSTRVASADTSASRTNKSGRRTVKLSPSQIAIAKKLGVPLEEYAKYVKD